MTHEESLTPKGLPINTGAPEFVTLDINGNEIRLEKLLKDFKGVLIDFFRGSW